MTLNSKVFLSLRNEKKSKTFSSGAVELDRILIQRNRDFLIIFYAEFRSV